jgi:hypothetical protein
MQFRDVRPQWGPYGQRALLVRREPWWTCLITSVVNGACWLSGHRWCNSALSHWAIRLGDRHADTFAIPVDRELLSAYCRWGGHWELDDLDDESDPGESR